MKDKFLLIVFLVITCIANAQEKGTSSYLDKQCGIYPVMLNDSITKHLKVLTPIGKIEKENTLCALDEDYCMINAANLIEVKIKFVDYLATNIIFFVSPTFANDCLAELRKLYGEPEKDGDKYTWKSKNVVLMYETKPSDFPGKAIGLFFRRQDLEK